MSDGVTYNKPRDTVIRSIPQYYEKSHLPSNRLLQYQQQKQQECFLQIFRMVIFYILYFRCQNDKSNGCNNRDQKCLLRREIITSNIDNFSGTKKSTISPNIMPLLDFFHLIWSPTLIDFDRCLNLTSRNIVPLTSWEAEASRSRNKISRSYSLWQFSNQLN